MPGSEQRKKNLILTLEYPPASGGVATYVENLAQVMDKDAVLVLEASLFPRWVWPRWLRTVLQVMKITAREPIGRMLIHHALPMGYVALLFKWFWKIPFVVFYHGTDVYAGTASAWKRRMLALVAAQAEVNIFDSASVQHRFLRFFPGLAEKCLVAPPGVDPLFLEAPGARAVEAIRDRYALGGKTVMLSVGRLVEGKGFPHMLRNFLAIAKAVPNLVWVIAGDGPKRETLAKRIEQLSLQNMVRLVGDVPHNELPALYGATDLFVLLTHPDEGKEEGFGLVFLEAAACGVPVVAGRSGGVEEAVLNEETGLIVDAHIDAQVVQACVTLLTDKEKANALSSRARERVEKEFQWDIVIERLKPWLA